jgi:hypothetical protein
MNACEMNAKAATTARELRLGALLLRAMRARRDTERGFAAGYALAHVLAEGRLLREDTPDHTAMRISPALPHTAAGEPAVPSLPTAKGA